MKRKAKDFIDNFMHAIRLPEMLILPGQLAFFFIMSIVPILTLISYGATTVNLSIDVITDFISKVFSNDISTLIMPSITNPTLSPSFFITLIVGFIIASNGAASIIITSNTIYGIKDRGFVRRRIKSIIMTFFLVLLFIFILIVPLFGNKIIEAIHYINIKDVYVRQIELLISVLNGPISWLIIFVFIKILYTMAPDINISSSQTNYGALFTTFGWIISTYIYSLYINNVAKYSIFYGGLANLIILMLWLYLLAFIFTIGLALNFKKNNDKEENTNNKNNKKVNNNNGSDK